MSSRGQRTNTAHRRYIVSWDLRESMTAADIEIILERAKELHPDARPSIISGNGPQRQNFALLSPIKPEIERWHKSLKGECIRPGTPRVGGEEGGSGLDSLRQQYSR